jgi:hypothetical protein
MSSGQMMNMSSTYRTNRLGLGVSELTELLIPDLQGISYTLQEKEAIPLPCHIVVYRNFEQIENTYY